tara:strand:- start:3134 stop:3640 length:507 start_codon:yes stop_codon:yes gene_type:complete
MIRRFSHIGFQLAAGVTLIILTGCSINHSGLKAFLDCKETNTLNAKTVYTKARGIYLYTDNAIGFQIGYIEREQLFPVLTENPDHCIEQLLGTSPVEAETEATEYSETPFVVEINRIGLGLELSPISLSGNLGITRNRKVQIPTDKSFSFFYLNMEDKKHKICANVNE